MKVLKSYLFWIVVVLVASMIVVFTIPTTREQVLNLFNYIATDEYKKVKKAI